MNLKNLTTVFAIFVFIGTFNFASAANCSKKLRQLLNEQDVIRYAAALHKGQKRKYSKRPYITHPIAVGKIIRRYSQDSDLYIAAIMHDTLEDTFATYAQILTRYGKRVADLVEEVTSNPHTREKFSSKAEYLTYKMNKMSKDALLIKLADRLHNVSDMVRAEDEFVAKYSEQTNYILSKISLMRNDLESSHKELIQTIFKSMRNSKQIIHAKKFAIDAYRGLYSNFHNEQFVDHSIRVGEILTRAGADIDTQRAGYLKNIEAFGKIENAREKIDTQFGKKVRQILDEIHVPKNIQHNSVDLFSLELQRPKWVSPEARMVLLATKLDYLQLLEGHKDIAYRNEYVKQVNAMVQGFDEILRELSPIEDVLLKQLKIVLERVSL